MKFSNQKRGQKYLNGYKDAIKEILKILNNHKEKPIEKIIIGLEIAINKLDNNER